jgi:hypothetical protein
MWPIQFGVWDFRRRLRLHFRRSAHIQANRATSSFQELLSKHDSKSTPSYAAVLSIASIGHTQLNPEVELNKFVVFLRERKQEADHRDNQKF